MMQFSFFWLPIVLAHSTPATAPIAENSAGPAWAAAVTERADAGWHLRDIATSENRQGVHIALTLASDGAAEEISVRYRPGAKSFVDFTQRAITLPTEKRDYEAEHLLFEELSSGAPTALSFGCADLFLEFGTFSVPLAQDEFSVSLWATEDKVGAALSTWLIDSLDGGELIDIRDERRDNGAQVVSQVIFVVDSEDGVEEMRVDLSEAGVPSYLQLMHSPGASYWESHPASQALRALASKSEINRLAFAEQELGESPRLEISGRGGNLSLDLAAFNPEEEACGC